MALFEDTNPRALKELLGQIQSGETALPDFQRDFVWEPIATQDLIVSIANNYPAGSLLRIRNTHDFFARRAFEGAPALKGKPTFLVLDGQQRLTSLYQAFYGCGEHRFYVRIRDLIEGKDFEDAIFHLRASAKLSKHLNDPMVQANELIMPLSILEGGFGGFGRWSKRAVRLLALQGDERTKLEDALDMIEEVWIRKIDDYAFPVVTLSDETPAEAVCTIFETLNRTGVKLSVFELLTARFWSQKINLRALWDQAKADYPALDDFEVDPYYVLQSIALIARPSPSCKRSEVLRLSAEDINQWWGTVADGLGRALQLLREDCGVFVPKWLPYSTILIPLAAILAKQPTTIGPSAAIMRQKILRWYWCSTFSQAYENAPNSQAAKDYSEVIRWLDGGEEPEVVRGFRFDPRQLRDTTVRQRGLYRGVIGLVLRKRARDFHTDQPISGDLILEEHIDDHHIFPKGYLRDERPQVPQRLRDCVLNRTLIDRTTNRRIRRRAPSDYMGEIRNTLGNASFEKLLASHTLPGGKDSPLWTNDFERFLEWRQNALWKEIQAATGVREESDLIEEEGAEAA